MPVTLALGTPAGGSYFPMELLLESIQEVEVGQNPGLCLTVSESASFQALPDSQLWHYRSVLPLPGAARRILEAAVVAAPSPVEPCVPHLEAAVVAAPSPVEPCVPHLEAAVVCPLHVGSRPDASCPSAYL